MLLAQPPHRTVKLGDSLLVHEERRVQDHHVGQEPVQLQVDREGLELVDDGLGITLSLVDDRRVRELPKLDPLEIG